MNEQRYWLATMLQDGEDNPEFFDSLRKAMHAAIRARNGPLGSCAMYSIWDSKTGLCVITNDQVIKAAELSVTIRGNEESYLSSAIADMIPMFRDEMEQGIQEALKRHHVKSATVQPPVGIQPLHFVLEQRLVLLGEAMQRYLKAEKSIPLEWFHEHDWLLKTLETQPYKVAQTKETRTEKSRPNARINRKRS